MSCSAERAAVETGRRDAPAARPVGVLDVARPKPHPDVVLKCLARLGVRPAAAVYVGDAESDLAAARA
ncbi:MAG: HAD family hydrolase, partial [Chloroflexi bacterium]|nr:HAD family hydrolase [Chloroflexota bacterium]